MRKMVAESLDEFAGDPLNEGFKDDAKEVYHKVKEYVNTKLKKVGEFFVALYEGMKLNASLPINIAINFINNGASGLINVVPSPGDKSKDPELSSLSGERSIAYRKEARKQYLLRLSRMNEAEYAKFSKQRRLFEANVQMEHPDPKISNITTEFFKMQVTMKIKNPTSTPLMIWGAPGIGKTQIVEQMLHATTGGRLIDIDAQKMSPEEWFMPYINHDDGKAKYTDLPKDVLPLYLPTGDLELDKAADEAVNEGAGGIIFFDELSRANDAVQGSCLKLIGERKLGKFKLGSKWAIISAGNRKSDEANSDLEFGSALGNRFVQFNFVPDFKSWKKYAMSKEMNQSMIDFLENYQENFYTKTNNPDDAIFASPRSWEAASREFALLKAECAEYGIRMNRTMVIDQVSGSVGRTVAEKYAAFALISEKYPIEEIKKIWTDPKHGPVIIKKGKSGGGVDEAEVIALVYAAVSMKHGQTITGKEFENFATWLVQIDHASTATYAFRLVFDKHPYMNFDVNFPDAPLNPTYQKGADIFLEKYSSWLP